MTIRTVLVCEAQVPFVEGGAEMHVRSLVTELRARGYDAELVSIPFKWYPKEEILAHAAAWRLIDLSESNGRPIDCVIATKFPTYFVRHPHKVTWLIHQYRAAYELAGTPYSDFDHIEGDVALRRTAAGPRHPHAGRVAAGVRERPQHGQSRASASTASRPSRCIILRIWRAGCSRRIRRYVLSVGRLETVKRAQLAIEAMASVDPGVSLVLVGDGTQRANPKRRSSASACADRVRFAGSVPTDTLIDLYAGALAVVYVPVRRGFRLRHARGVPLAEAGHHGARFGRPARVRGRWRERRDLEPDAGGDRRGDQRVRCRPAPCGVARRCRSCARVGGHVGRRHRDAAPGRARGARQADDAFEADHSDPVPQRGGDTARDARGPADEHCPESIASRCCHRRRVP